MTPPDPPPAPPGGAPAGPAGVPPGWGEAAPVPWRPAPGAQPPDLQPPDLRQWQRLHPASAIVRIGPGLAALLALYLLPAAAGGSRSDDWIHLAVVALVLLGGLVTWLVTRWRLADGVLQIETGLIRRQSLRFPLTQIQAIDVVRPGMARIFGLAELRVRMAGGRSRGRLSYLTLAHAEALRAQLLAAAHARQAGQTAAPARPPVETPLYSIDPRRLLVSLLISGPSVLLLACVVALAVLATVAPGVAQGVAAGSIAYLFGFATAIWRRFNGEYRLTVADTADGLHVRSGLVETSAETIPRGRVQALRLVQPLTWRPMGWWRVEVDVAGKAIGGRRNRSAKQAGKALLPVGTRSQAAWITERVFPGASASLLRPPGRARWKSPLRYGRLSAGLDTSYAVTTSGRLRRVTDWVPLAKVQSVRYVQGPVQRRLGLASIHLDTAGRSVFAVLRDRDEREAAAWFASLPDACRHARAEAPPIPAP
ncbi:MAG TPA: PH domain-containing protein [Acidimicrobiales bacterium]|nr:PH domain-containing protein [Acidimicrobiales bacterium]